MCTHAAQSSICPSCRKGEGRRGDTVATYMRRLWTDEARWGHVWSESSRTSPDVAGRALPLWPMRSALLQAHTWNVAILARLPMRWISSNRTG